MYPYTLSQKVRLLPNVEQRSALRIVVYSTLEQIITRCRAIESNNALLRANKQDQFTEMTDLGEEVNRDVKQPAALTEEEATRYDRQMRLWGIEAQQRY